MILSVLGTGKTGSKVKEICLKEQDQDQEQKKEKTQIIQVLEYNSLKRPSLVELEKCDVIISFLTGEVFLTYLPLLIEVKKPLVIASTGFSWPEGLEIDSFLKDNQLSWIISSNFSLGIFLKKQLIQSINQFQSFYDGKMSYSLHEIHHQNKKDAPSGTAKSIASWLNVPHTDSITFQRREDITGIHQLDIKLEGETLSLKHTAHDRDLFAKGAVLAGKILHQKKLKPGLHEFYNVLEDQFLSGDYLS